ncbi:MAG: hypothetical protein EOO15_02700 [Chitinophagaceae bacterium]|nr:MAG: hypothetical protein EOO15_02700 [Chitinophagaceae bacterium]
MARPNAYSRFIEDPALNSSVVGWLRQQELVAVETAYERGIAFHYSSLGPLHLKPDGSIDVERSPIVKVDLPAVRRQVLWTVGEVSFLAAPLSQFPELEKLRRSFLKWFAGHPLVYDSHDTGTHQYDYYLEGSAMNWGPIRALPSGLSALKSERYFVSCRETDGSLSTVCKSFASEA